MNKFMYCLFVPFFTILCLSGIFFSPSAYSAEMQEEIDHLLSYIETSNCTFIRNKSRHTSAKAVKHISKKYNHLKKRIKTTEDFIKGAATGSSISGKPYMIICNDNEMATADWLLAELELYRSKHP